jgi:hypothetical protein
MVFIAAAVAAVTLNSGLQQQKKENDALNSRINGLQRAIRLEQLSQQPQPTIADFEQRLAAEKAALDDARRRLPSSANLVNYVGDLVIRAEANYLIAIPLSSEPPAGDLNKSTYQNASVKLQVTGHETDLMVFLAGLERAGSGDFIIESISVSLDPSAGLDSVPPLNESIVTANVTLSVNFRPPAPAAKGAQT